MDERTSRELMLIGGAALNRLRNAHVAVFGLGGVGSWCAEALARAGVGELTLIDQDTVSLTNVNRQVIALSSTVGKPKAQVMAERVYDINPVIRTHPVIGTYNAENRERFFADYDFVADAIDLVSCKLDLILSCIEREIPIISALGTGNKKNAALLEITDISKTYGCALARVMRKELRTRGINHLDVVFSPEEPMEPTPLEAPPPGRRSVPGSLVWVPAAAGLLMAQHIITKIVDE